MNSRSNDKPFSDERNQVKEMRSLDPKLRAFKIEGDHKDVDGMYRFDHPKIKTYKVFCIASSGMGWDHVSVSLQEVRGSGLTKVKRTPTWGEMCWVKDLFFNPDECAMQYHPAESDYVDMHPYCLHIWRPHVDFPKPLKIMV